MTARPVRIAMWSWPRGISTALMRAFENRPHTVMTDEPLHGPCPRARDRPGRVVIAAQPGDGREVVAPRTGPGPAPAALAEAGRPYYERLREHRLGASAA